MHRTAIRFARATCAALALAGTLAHAQTAAAPDYPYIHKLWHATYDVDKDGRVTETVEQQYQVLQESKLEDWKVYGISFSTSIQSGDVLEAYTLKKDGRKLPVPASNYQKQTNDGRSGARPMFSDRTRISVVFPDLGVGDSVYVRYRIAEKEPMFPGQFSLAVPFSPYAPYEKASVTVRLPKDMKVLTESHKLEAAAPSESEGKRVLEWRYANPKPRSYSEDEDSGLWERSEYPNVLVSTFDSYEAIAKAYGDRALPKAQPTPRIRELAAQIVGAEKNPREKARLLYEWVSRSITYGGNCIGVGAVVPRDLDVVLDNKMGDCKDHATLLQSLLSAQGVRSEQVLINAGSEYDLAKTPVVSLVNHVMNYLPDFDLYVDATAKQIPFGYLPDGSYGKPVIHIGAAKALAVVPAVGARGQQRLAMELKVAENGSASGAIRVLVKGAAAAAMRAYMRNLSAEAEKDFVKQALSGYGYRGKGTLEKGDVSGLVDSYEYAVKFQIDNYLRSGANGVFVLAPVMESPFPVMRFAGVEEARPAKRRQVCSGFLTEETYVLDLPSNVSLLALPDNLDVHTSMVDYSAKYEKTPTGLRVARVLHDKTSQSVCPPDVMNDFYKQAKPVGENLSTQVIYKRKMQ